jgi:para-nitrobenzyl esterase
MALLKAKTGKGAVRGVAREGYTVFRGLPYAKAPIGPLRWKAPVETEAWAGIYSADRFPPICPQDAGRTVGFYDKEFYTDGATTTPMSEDCLYLNIWTPAKSNQEKLPVAFWIHGGAFLGGYGHEKEFDGAAFCRRGVILVTINYRLGVFGFLAHPLLSAENRRGVSGNYGILDQIAALNWVRGNIGAFGGDAENITVFGQSAGSISAQVVASSELAAGSFAKLILQSAGGYRSPLTTCRTLEQAEKIGQCVMEKAGVSTLSQLRQLPAKTLIACGEAAAPAAGMDLPFGPVLDGFVLSDQLDSLLAQGRVAEFPSLVGSNANDLDCASGATEAAGQGVLSCGCIDWSMVREEKGRSPTYVYHFARALPGDDAGAFHSAELWYVFGTCGRCWRPMTAADEALSRRMTDYWTNFMKTGDPNRPGLSNLPAWKPCTKQDPYVQTLDI